MTGKFVLAITGPAGSGKTTVGNKLAQQLDKCVDIDADRVKHFVVSGFRYETEPDGKKRWMFDEWPLVGDSLGLLASNFQKQGYNVVINGFLDRSAWDELEKHIRLTHKVLLLPNVETVVNRDKERPGDKPMGETAVTEHYKHFTSDSYYHNFTKIDSSEHDVDETVQEIAKLLE